MLTGCAFRAVHTYIVYRTGKSATRVTSRQSRQLRNGLLCCMAGEMHILRRPRSCSALQLMCTGEIGASSGKHELPSHRFNARQWAIIIIMVYYYYNSVLARACLVLGEHDLVYDRYRGIYEHLFFTYEHIPKSYHLTS